MPQAFDWSNMEKEREGWLREFRELLRSAKPGQVAEALVQLGIAEPSSPMQEQHNNEVHSALLVYGISRVRRVLRETVALPEDDGFTGIVRKTHGEMLLRCFLRPKQRWDV